MATPNERGPDDGGDVRATEAESPGQRSLGVIVPRPGIWVALSGGPLDGRLVRREHWNGAVQLARCTVDRFGVQRPHLHYQPEVADDVVIIPLRYTGGGS